MLNSAAAPRFPLPSSNISSSAQLPPRFAQLPFPDQFPVQLFHLLCKEVRRKMNTSIASKNTSKAQEQKRASSSSKDQPRRKQRKGQNPVRIPPATEPHADTRCPNSDICISLNSIANLQKEYSDDGGRSGTKQMHSTATDIEPESSFKVQDLGKISRLAWVQEKSDGADIKKCSGDRNFLKPDAVLEDRSSSIPRDIDLNVSLVPDLNVEFMPPVETPKDNWNHTKTDEGPVVDSQVEACPKTNNTVEMQDTGSNMSNVSPSQTGNMAGSVGENLEYCLKTIRQLECKGHIKTEFRKKFMTWFSLRSTEKERRVVHSFIQILKDDPSSLADQLVDTFSKIILASK